MEIELTRIQRLRLALFGRVYLDDRKLEGGRGYLPFYAFNCSKHGLVEDYPHNFYSPFYGGGIPVKLNGVLSRLKCPRCAEEQRAYTHLEIVEKVVQEVLGDAA